MPGGWSRAGLCQVIPADLRGFLSVITGGEHNGVVFPDLPLGPEIPAPMDEVRPAPDPDRIPVPVIPEADEVEGWGYFGTQLALYLVWSGTPFA